MNVTAPEKKWTDHRLDDLARKVDAGVAEADKPLGEFRGEVNARFDKVDSKIDGLDSKFDKKFDRLTYYIWGLGAGIIAALIGPNGL
jgi:tetrahydromethanopterin S-methyltransferase subunit G